MISGPYPNTEKCFSSTENEALKKQKSGENHSWHSAFFMQSPALQSQPLIPSIKIESGKRIIHSLNL